MPRIAGLTRKQSESLLDLIARRVPLGAVAGSPGLDLGDEPFTEVDIRRGEDLFTGVERLANGGSAVPFLPHDRRSRRVERRTPRDPT